MIDLFLRADTPEALRGALPLVWDETESVWITGTVDFAFDPIGPVVITEATYDDSGEVLIPAVLDHSFHANLRLVDASLAGLVPGELLVTPDNPVRIFA